MEKIRFVHPRPPGLVDIQEELNEILESGILSFRLGGKNVQKFQDNMKEYTGKMYAIGTSSCTSGLMLLLSHPKFKGSVIVPSFTFHATAAACKWNNLDILFADVDYDTMTMDVDYVEFLLSNSMINSYNNISAILVANMFGNPPDFERLYKLCVKYDVSLIVDAAQSIGSMYKGKNAGYWGHVEVFSYSASKLLTGGEGGCVVTDDYAIKDWIEKGLHYGAGGSYDPEFAGLNARMPEFNALLLNKQYDRLNDIVEKQLNVFHMYEYRLSDLVDEGFVSFQKEQPGGKSSRKECTIRILNGKRDKISVALVKAGIEHKQYWSVPVHKTKAYKQETYLENTEKLAKEVISLPMHFNLTEESIDYICSVIKENI